jgi:hypothetical protein
MVSLQITIIVAVALMPIVQDRFIHIEPQIVADRFVGGCIQDHLI